MGEVRRGRVQVPIWPIEDIDHSHVERLQPIVESSLAGDRYTLQLGYSLAVRLPQLRSDDALYLKEELVGHEVADEQQARRARLPYICFLDAFTLGEATPIAIATA